MSAGEGKRDGFALILVIWILVLIGAIGAYLVAGGRAQARLAFNIHASASAEALADAGIARTAFNQSDPVIADHWKLDGEPHRISTPEGFVVIRLRDENQKVNPNLASQGLLAALFEACGVERGVARRLGAAVADWVSPDGLPREGGAKLDQYRAAGRSYGPANAAFESLDELQLVLGMTPAILSSVRPYLTIYTQSPAPDGKDAPRPVQRAIALAAQTPDNASDNAPIAQPDGEPHFASGQGQPTPQPENTAEGAPLIEAEITAHSREGGIFIRYAVLRLLPEQNRLYSVLDWRRDLPEGPKQD